MTKRDVINAGVNHLKKSYPRVTADTIMTDIIYKAFFRSSLEQTIQDAPANLKVAQLCQQLIDEIDCIKN